MTFALWLTGLPASGKSTIARALIRRGLRAEVLESDEVRRILTPAPSYSREERDLFYRALAFCGARLVAHGVNVIFDATATQRAYRDVARGLIPAFFEVFVDCPLPVAERRDLKGTYARGESGRSSTVPGLQEAYEPPLHPDLRLDTSVIGPEEAAARIIALLSEKQALG